MSAGTASSSQAIHDALEVAGVAHEADMPDLPRQAVKAGADLQIVVLIGDGTDIAAGVCAAPFASDQGVMKSQCCLKLRGYRI